MCSRSERVDKMKRNILLAILAVGLFAGQAFADMWEVDKDTALLFTDYVVTQGSLSNSLSVYDSPTSKYFGTGPDMYGPMSGQVGFYGGLAGDAIPGTAIMEIFFEGALGLDGAGYDGISCYFQNDDQSIWSFQLFYVTAEGEHASAWAELGGLGGSKVLTASAGAPGGLDLEDIEKIGFRVMGTDMGGASQGHPSYSDDFHVSIVPVPGAILLGLLGLGAAGVKLRRFS
jgi:hypothetical protein